MSDAIFDRFYWLRQFLWRLGFVYLIQTAYSWFVPWLRSFFSAFNFLSKSRIFFRFQPQSSIISEQTIPFDCLTLTSTSYTLPGEFILPWKMMSCSNFYHSLQGHFFIDRVFLFILTFWSIAHQPIVQRCVDLGTDSFCWFYQFAAVRLQWDTERWIWVSLQCHIWGAISHQLVSGFSWADSV